MTDVKMKRITNETAGDTAVKSAKCATILQLEFAGSSADNPNAVCIKF